MFDITTYLKCFTVLLHSYYALESVCSINDNEKQQVENNDACDLFIVTYSFELSVWLATHVAYLNGIENVYE